ncbi:MAG: hypothetical protein QXS27_04045 [Candidatus Jordarchaeaceae archaeon]
MFDKLKKKAEEVGKRAAATGTTKAAEKAAGQVLGKISDMAVKSKTPEAQGDPKEVAIKAYECLQKGDRKGWVETLSLQLQKTVDLGGSTASFWWNTGRHYIEDYGVYYEFLKEDRAPFPNQRKFFFKRKNPDGSDRGAPVPCTVRIDEDGVWRVDQQSV